MESALSIYFHCLEGMCFRMAFHFKVECLEIKIDFRLFLLVLEVYLRIVLCMLICFSIDNRLRR